MYKRQVHTRGGSLGLLDGIGPHPVLRRLWLRLPSVSARAVPVSYTHLRAHETVLDLVCRLLLEKKKRKENKKKKREKERKNRMKQSK